MADSYPRTAGKTSVEIADEVVTITATDLDPAKFTPTGRPRRTRAEIATAAIERRQRIDALKADRSAERLQARQKRAKEKAKRALRAKTRHEAAAAKRTERWRKWQTRADRKRGCSQVIVPRSTPPRRICAERLQDDPDKSNCNHIVDAWSLDYEDTIIAWIDGDGAELEETVEALLVDLRVEESVESQVRQTEHLASIAAMFPDDRGDSIKWSRETRRLKNLSVFHNPGGRRRFAA